MTTPKISPSLSDRINRLSESQTLEMAKKARELKEKGIDIISLSLGEPDFKTPDHICQAAKKAIDEGFTFYPPVSGIADLRKAIAEKLRRDNGLDFKAENIVVSTGAKQSIANVMLCLINPGDEVIVFSPYWVSYMEIIKLAEGVPVLVQGAIENDYKVTVNALERAITPKTKAIIYSSPCNPTGTVFSESDLRSYAAVIARHENIYVIADEIYEYINFTNRHFSIGTVPEIAERVITVNGFSKGFAMTGWRVGYIGAKKWIADACEKMQGQITSGVCSIAQKAALEAISADLAPTKEMAKAYLRRRDLIYGLLKEIPGMKLTKPEGAFYMFPDIRSFIGKKHPGGEIKHSYDLSLFLLADAHVSTVSGEAFGAPNCLRLSYANSDEQLIEAVKRIKNSLSKLQ